jgi:hypothetical protein
MLITLWSPGMAAAAPMIVNPVGCRLSDLPFKDANDCPRLYRFFEQICDAPAEHDHTRTFMLHLAAQNRHVLLELTAALVHAAESDPHVVLTGRQIDSNLAGLLMARSVAALSHDGDNGPSAFPTLRSVSQSGSNYGDDEDSRAALDDDVSSVTMSLPSFMGGSSISSLTTSTLNPPLAACDAAATDRLRLVLRSAHSGRTASTSSPVSRASAQSGSISLFRLLNPAAPSGPMTPHGWDDNSTTRDLARIRPIRTSEELRARPAFNAFIDDLYVARKQCSRTARQSEAYHNTLTKLFTLGCFLRFARERASLRVLFVEGPAVIPHLAIPNAARRVVAEFMWIGGRRASASAGGFSARGEDARPDAAAS